MYNTENGFIRYWCFISYKDDDDDGGGDSFHFLMLQSNKLQKLVNVLQHRPVPYLMMTLCIFADLWFPEHAGVGWQPLVPVQGDQVVQGADRAPTEGSTTNGFSSSGHTPVYLGIRTYQHALPCLSSNPSPCCCAEIERRIAQPKTGPTSVPTFSYQRENTFLTSETWTFFFFFRGETITCLITAWNRHVTLIM